MAFKFYIFKNFKKKVEMAEKLVVAGGWKGERGEQRALGAVERFWTILSSCRRDAVYWVKPTACSAQQVGPRVN